MKTTVVRHNWPQNDTQCVIKLFKISKQLHKDDPEFALMGLLLCYPCKVCKMHVPADNDVCYKGYEQEVEDVES